MHIGNPLTGASFGARLQPRRLTLAHVVADIPRLSDTFVADEIRALRALGHAVVPVVLAPLAQAGAEAIMPDPIGLDAALVPPGDPRLHQEAVSLDEVETLAALTGAAGNPAGLAAPVGLAPGQRSVSRRALLRAAARLAHVARARGCTHLHAHFAQSAAATAICAARIAGITASFTVHGSDMLSAATGNRGDVALKLAAADLAVAVSEGIADEVRRLAP